MKKLLHRPEGFTLIELMIVVLIIAILVAIAVPVYLNSRASAQKRTCQSNQRIVDGAVEAYQMNDTLQRYPDSLERLTEAGVQVIKSIPKCPVNGNYTWVTVAGNTGAPPIISCTAHPAQD